VTPTVGPATRRRLTSSLVNLAGVVTLLVFAFPVYWMFATAFKPSRDILTYTPRLLPWPPTLEHFQHAVSRPYFGAYLRNSLAVTGSAVLLSLLIATLAALAVGRFDFSGRKAYLLLVLVVQMAPFEALLIPFFLMLRQLDLLNRLPALVLIYFIFTMPFTTWTLRGFVVGVPRELEEAAMVDGCTRMQAFRKVVLPLLAPGLVATSIFAFVTALFTLPVLAFFLVIHRRLASGLAAGVVKG